MDDRIGIPNDLRRKVLVEAGHRCAIPTCRHIDVDVHHIIPWAECQSHEYENLIALCPNCHRRAGRGEIDRKSLRIYKLNLRFVHDKYSQLEMDVLFELRKQPLNSGLLWPPFFHIFLKRLLDSGFVGVQDSPDEIVIGEMRLDPTKIYLTTRGREFVDALGLKEL